MNQQRGCLLAIGIPLLLLLLFIGGSNLYYHIRMQRYADSMFSMAKQLGYTPQTHLDQGRACVGPWVTSWGICYFYVAFTTPVSAGQLDSQVKVLKIPVYSDTGLEAAPSERKNCNRVREWSLEDLKGREFKVDFCETSRRDPRLQDNGITVSIRVGEVPIWVKLPHDVPIPKEVND